MHSEQEISEDAIAFRTLSNKVWSAALEHDEKLELVDRVVEERNFTLTTKNTWCRLTFDPDRSRVSGTFGWYGSNFEVTAKELFALDLRVFENPEVMADLVISELLQALRN